MTEALALQRYARLSIFLHWAMFLLIAGAYSCILLRKISRVAVTCAKD